MVLNDYDRLADIIYERCVVSGLDETGNAFLFLLEMISHMSVRLRYEILIALE